MAQHDYNIANQSGADFRADLNNALSAIATVNSGATEPTTTFSHQLWVDTANNVLKIRNAANSAFITTGVSITTSNTFTGNLTGNVTGDLTGDVTGSILTASQPNITSLGSLTALTSASVYITGTAASTRPLHISGTSTIAAEFEQTDASKEVRVLLEAGGTNAEIQFAGASHSTLPNTLSLVSPSITRFVNSGVTSMVIDNTSKVGIGIDSSIGAPLHIQYSGIGSGLIIESTDGGASAAPDLVLIRNSASPADDDQIGNIVFRGIDDGANSVTYGRILVEADDVTSGSEDSTMHFSTIVNGTLDERITIKGSNVGINNSNPTVALDVTGSVIATEEFIGDIDGAVRFTAKADEALSKGDVVYVSGVSGNTTTVGKAKADDTSKMPAFGMAIEDANANNNLQIVTFGNLTSIDTSNESVGEILYVSTTAGEYTTTAPSGESSQIQNIGKVLRSHQNNGSIKVGGAGRSNATPNLDNGKIFIGNGSNQSSTTTLDTSIVVENTNLYYTQARFNSAFGNKTTADLTENTNLYYTDTRANSAIDTRVTKTFVDALGIQATSVSANSVALGTDTTGNYVATITGTANKVSVSGSGSESAAITLTLPDDVQIADSLTVAGNLTVNGTLTSLDTTNLDIEDNLFQLNAGLTGSPVNDSGMLINRGNQDNGIFMWDESVDKFTLGLTTADGTSTGNITLSSLGTLVANVEGDLTGTIQTAAQPNITSLGTLTGLTSSGTISVGDDVQAHFGDSADLRIYHDGSNSYVSEAGTGNLILAADNLRVTNAAGNEAKAHFNSDGAVNLFYDNVQKFATSSTGVDVTGTVTATTLAGTLSTAAQPNITSLGTLTGLTSSGTVNISNSSGFGNLELGGASGGYIDFKTPFVDDHDARIMYAGSQLVISTIADQPILLKHNDATVLTTSSTGIDVTGVITTDGLTTSADINFGDNDKAIFGSGSDLEIYHDGSNSFIRDNGDGDLFIEASNNHYLRFINGEYAIVTAENAGVGLRYNNVEKIVTTDDGALIKEGLTVGSSANDLGTTAGNQLTPLTLRSDTSNTDSLLFTTERLADGTDWTTAAHRIQRKVDSTKMGYIQLGNFGSDLITFGENASEYMRLDGAGQLGLGTDSPDTLMEIVGADPVLTIRDTETGIANANATLRLAESGGSSTLGAYFDVAMTGQNLTFGHSTDGSADVEQMRLEGSTGDLALGVTSASGRLHVNKNGTGQIIALFSSDLGTNNRNMQILSPASDSASAPFEFSTSNSFQFTIDGGAALNIAADKNVGIGTVSPARPLHISGTTVTQLELEQTSASSDVRMLLDAGGTNGQIQFAGASHASIPNTLSLVSAGDTRFVQAGQTVMHIDSASGGRVGIGNTNPSAALDVTGEILGKTFAYSYYNSSSTTLTTSYAVMNLDTLQASTGISGISISSNVVTVSRSGTFMITMDIVTDVTLGSARSVSEAQLYKNGSAVTGTFVGMYNRVNGAGLSTGSATTMISVSSGDTFEIRAKKTGTDTVVTSVGGTRLTFLQIGN